MADYRILLRSPTTLKLIEELTTWRSATWTRRHVAAGHFDLSVDASEICQDESTLGATANESMASGASDQSAQRSRSPEIIAPLWSPEVSEWQC